MENLNLVELLRDCPTGIELDCTMFDNVTFVRVDYEKKQFPIEISISGLRSKYLTKEGCFHDTTLLPEAKCVIFPKGKTTCEGFVPPCKFKDGDVISVIINKNHWYGIYQKELNDVLYCYASYSTASENVYLSNKSGMCLIDDISEIRLATEEEKQKLFDAIKANGYKWNAETKTLEKLPKFKVGDRIRHKTHIRQGNVVTEIKDTHYILDDELALPFISQDEYELVPIKFDINTLKAFDKVLVRFTKGDVWNATLFSHYDTEVKCGCYHFVTISSKSYPICIPYEANKELLGTTNDCDEFYKTW